MYLNLKKLYYGIQAIKNQYYTLQAEIYLKFYEKINTLFHIQTSAHKREHIIFLTLPVS